MVVQIKVVARWLTSQKKVLAKIFYFFVFQCASWSNSLIECQPSSIPIINGKQGFKILSIACLISGWIQTSSMNVVHVATSGRLIRCCKWKGALHVATVVICFVPIVAKWGWRAVFVRQLYAWSGAAMQYWITAITVVLWSATIVNPIFPVALSVTNCYVSLAPNSVVFAIDALLNRP
jgi:hypothetical protein